MNTTALPARLPAPDDDGAADHLPGLALPKLELLSTAGELIQLNELGSGRTVIYAYPMTGRPGVELPPGWDSIPGARGCTPQACAFRDHYRDLVTAGIDGVFGLSVQDSEYQREAVERLHLPFAMLSDCGFELAEAIGLPTFVAAGARLYRRLTMIVTAGDIEHIFYPVFPPDQHADQVLGWLAENPR